MTRDDPDELVRVAEALARDAGALALRMRAGAGASVAATKSSPTDVVTGADTAAEELIRSTLHRARPGDAVLGEEVGRVEGSTGVRWVVDPIDGTVNYLYGIPAWAVSVAAEVDGEVVAGCVHEPASGQTWTAVRGGGALLDGRGIAVSESDDLTQALVGTGFGYAAARRARQAQVLSVVLPRVRDIRRAGSAALDLCAVATGRLDGYYERGLNDWDRAAGQLVAVEAGARVGGLHGAPPGPDLVVAATPRVFDALVALLEGARADAEDGT